MRLPKDAITAGVRIVGERKTGGRGTIGTGFLLSVPSEVLVDVRHTYVITAHHVIDAQHKVEIQGANPFQPSHLYPAFEVTDWDHPIETLDLALAILDTESDEGGDQILRGTDWESMMPPKHVPGLGGPVIYIGYLAPADRMMARSGTVGALEQTGIKLAEPMYDYECHLVDCRSFDGFSGSPVFFIQEHPILEETPKFKVLGPMPDDFPPIGSTGNFPVICGMFTEYLEDKSPNQDGTVSRYGVGIVLPSREIWSALMTKEQKGKRRKLDEERKAREGEDGPAFRQASLSEDDEYARFERLAGQLANTPKQGSTEK